MMDASSSSSEAMARQNLLDRLLNSVKQVQVYFGARQEIATESDARVSALCVEWEMVLSHGARKPKPKNSLRLTGRTAGVSLWPLAKLCVSAEDLQRFDRLNCVTSELGKGRAWLRAAINERTLENYMHTVLSQEEELRRLYEADAFLLDQEHSSMLPVMAAGLSSIIFSISIDANYLNTPLRSVEVPSVQVPSVQVPSVQVPSVQVPSVQVPSVQVPSVQVPSVEAPFTRAQVPAVPSAKSQPPPVVNSVLQDYLSESRPPPHLPSREPEPDDDDMIAISTKVKKKKSKKSKSKSPQAVVQGSTLPTSEDAPNLEATLVQVEDDKAVPLKENASSSSISGDRPLPLKESASSSSSRLSLDSVTEEGGHAPLYVALATTPGDLVSGEAVAAANATALVLSASTVPPAVSTQQQPVVSGDEASGTVSPSTSEELTTQQPLTQTGRLSPDSEMRSAMLTLSKMKDELELQNKELRVTVSEQQKALEKLDQELAGMREAHSGQRLALERENDLLREQLKKYVNMVQAQRKENSLSASDSISSSNSGVPAPRAASEERSPTPEFSQDKAVTTAEKKLHDMAEMYGDLMELNERLHRNLADRDSTICALVRSLREASVEVPLPSHQLPAAAMEPRVLVEVWIPSVIKKGRGPDGFHVYQVFVSVKGVEWNVYRRYTEFREFHRQLQKHVHEVSTFKFPPKKAIGNKSSQVVEERRQRLQEYLRFVIKCCSSKQAGTDGKSQCSEAIITPSISKQTLISIFPFFKEDFNQDPSPSPAPPLYSGL